MAVYKLFPTKDATIYSQYPFKNTGLDEILDLSSNYNDLINTGNNTALYPEIARSLLQFSQTDINNIFANQISGSIYKVYLKLFLANASSIPLDYTLKCHPISESFDMGTGRYGNYPETTDGVSWRYRTDLLPWISQSFASGVTASYSGSNVGGGVYYTSSVSQSFNYASDKDIEFDVTDFVTAFYSGSIVNNGFIIKQSNEFSTASIFNLKYFSMDTHTIYPPQLEFRWNDNTFITGSKTIASSNQIIVSLGNNKGEYQQGSIQDFNIHVRDRFPARQFTTSSVYTLNKILPSSSYWAIKDLQTEETVIDFDTNYTTINCNGTSSYFRVYMDGLQPERSYRVLIKTIIGGQTLIFDDESLTFRVKK